VLALITACDPIVSIALAHFWLEEKLASSPAGVAGEVASLLVMIAGIIVLAHHAPAVTRQLEEAGDPPQKSAACAIVASGNVHPPGWRYLPGPAGGNVLRDRPGDAEHGELFPVMVRWSSGRC